MRWGAPGLQGAAKLDPKAMVGNTDAALTAVLDKLSQISSVAERIGLAKKMGLEEFIPLLSLSSEALAELRKEAERPTKC